MEEKSRRKYPLWPASSTWSQYNFCLRTEILVTSNWWENSKKKKGDGENGQTQAESFQWQTIRSSSLRFPISIAQIFEVLNPADPLLLLRFGS